MAGGDGFTDEERRRIDELAARPHFTVDDAKAIVRMASVDRHDRDPSMLVHRETTHSADSITESDCKQIRRAMKQAESAREVINVYPQTHPSVIYRHAQGRCNHDHDVEPTTSPRIKPDECYKIRRAFATGDDVDDLINDFHRSQNTIMRHLFGTCDHDLSNYKRESVTETECRRLRRLYATEADLRVDDLAVAFLISKGAVHYHLMGKCDHPEDGIIESNGRVSPDECDEMRRAYDRTPSVRQLAKPSNFDRDTGTVYRHVFGKCEHVGDVDAVEPPARHVVDSAECTDLRRDYKANPDATVHDLAGTEIGYTTAYEHIFGLCSHGNTDEPPADPPTTGSRHKS